MADGVAITAGVGTTIATDDCGAPGHTQIMKLAISTDGSATLIPAEATNGLDVDVTRVIPGTSATHLGKAEDAPHGDGDTGVLMLGVRNHSAPGSDGDYAVMNIASNGGLKVGGCQNHDDVDAGGPIKIGHRAIAHGANPTAVAAADRTDWYANRHGIPFVIGGHRNTTTVSARLTGANTDAALAPTTVSAGQRLVISRLTVTISNATTVNVDVKIGFGATTLPADSATGATGVIVDSDGFAPGGGVNIGSGDGIVAIGGDGEELRVTNGAPTTGAVHISYSYYLIES